MEIAGLMTAINDVIAERQRQVEAEGWTPEHDDTHARGEMAEAAGSYAIKAAYTLNGRSYWPHHWPWHMDWWKPKNPRRDLVRAAALIIAEIERLDRADAGESS